MWSGIPKFKNFPQFVVIHTVKGFGVVNEHLEVHGSRTVESWIGEF